MTLLIKNVKILIGKKDYGESRDVFIVGDKISAIGSFPQKQADLVLDGGGAYLSPGFIDPGSTADHYLEIFENPGEEQLLSQGITTIVGGQCGFSLAPLLYGRLDMIRKWTDINKINVNWHSIKEFFASLKKKKLGVNFASLTGHLTIRQELLGDAARDLTANESAVLKKVAGDSLKEGSCGISFGLEYSHGKATPFKELRMLSEIVAKENGVCAMHLRNRGKGVAEAFQEARAIAETTGAKTVISHFAPLESAKGEYEAILMEMYELPPKLPLYITVRPLEENIMPIYFLLPDWAQKGSLEDMLNSVKDDWLTTRIMKEMPKFDPVKVTVLKAVKNESLEGKNLKEIMEIFGLANSGEALRKLMISTGLRATISLAELDPVLLNSALKHPRSMIGTFAPKGEASARSNLLKFLEKVEQEELLSLRDIVWKMTAFPARVFGLNGRGEIAEGNIADLTVFKNGEIKFTILGGNLAYKAGEKIETQYGGPLAHTADGF